MITRKTRQTHGVGRGGRNRLARHTKREKANSTIQHMTKEALAGEGERKRERQRLQVSGGEKGAK